MRLIDADAAVKLLRGKCVAKYPVTFCIGLFAAADEIAKLPTVDAVEVVRCRDCKHYGTSGCAMDAVSFDVTEESFCSYGERRDTDDKGRI